MKKSNSKKANIAVNDALLEDLKCDNEKGLKSSIDNGLSVNAIVDISRKETLLHYAGKFGSHKCMSMLIDHGADLFAKDKNGTTPLEVEIIHYTPRALDKVKLLLNAKSTSTKNDVIKFSIFNKAITVNRPELDDNINLLINYVDKHFHSELSARNHEGMTPIHLATFFDKISIAKSLIRAGAHTDLLTKDRHLETALHMAVRLRRQEIALLLIREGAAMDLKNNEKQTPLHLATQSQKYSLVNELIAKRANVNAIDNELETPAHYAVRFYEYEVLDRIITAKANINTQTIEGYTPLHLAYMLKNHQAVYQLINAQADGNILDNYNCLPVDYTNDELNKNLSNLMTLKKGLHNQCQQEIENRLLPENKLNAIMELSLPKCYKSAWVEQIDGNQSASGWEEILNDKK